MAPNCTLERMNRKNSHLWCDFHYFGAVGQVEKISYALKIYFEF